MQFNLFFLDSFDSEFKGKTYTIYRFLDVQSLQIISGTNLKGDFEQYKLYKCRIEWNHNKLKVVGASL